MKKEKSKRDYNIDFLRGISTLFIILIHTAWWSGTSYLPEWFRNMTLLIDVPTFMFISGFSFNYINSVFKTIKGIIKQWGKWIYFLLFYTAILLLFFREQFIPQDVFSWLAYNFPHSNNIEVVKGSIWFMPMYIKVSLLCSMIICLINKYLSKEKEKSLMTVLSFFLFLILYCSNGVKFLFIDSYIAFYSYIYILGYLLYNRKIKSTKKFILYELINFLILIIVFKMYALNINDIQKIKFPPIFPYLLFSNISIILFWYLKDKIKLKKENVINYIGKNSIDFYFSQGISSSFIYYILRILPFKNPCLTFITMLMANLICTTIGAIVLEKSYKFLANIKTKLQDKKCDKNDLRNS